MCIEAEGTQIPRGTVSSVTLGQFPDTSQRTSWPCIFQSPCVSHRGCEVPEGKQSTFHKTSGSVTFPLHSVGHPLSHLSFIY